MSEIILTVTCVEPEGTFERVVKKTALSEERLKYYWEKLKKFDTLFNRHIVDVDDFIQTFLSQTASGEPQANGLVWEVDDVGIFFLTDIYPAFQATGHFTFWDQRFRGRENLVKAMIRYAFEEYGFRRVVAEVPLYTVPTMRAVEKVGFVKEGRLRKATWYQGEWWDVNLYSILKEESVENGT